IVGSTGSGKTAFMKKVLGDLFKAQSDVVRRSSTENRVDTTHTWFRVGKKKPEAQSTTTLSINTAGILLVRTLFNTIEFHPTSAVDDILLRDDIEEVYKLNFFDNAGQERFDFMPEITMRGSDAVIIIVDGTNMSSVEKIHYFLELVNVEQDRTNGSKIPIIVLLNKADLMDHGCYIGLDSIKHLLGFQAEFHETSMITGKGVDDSIRTLANVLHERSKT
ncbi:MAG: GTP-binding protein, partial [Candidatus Heimdallarchaeota archaeon]|nr:GTP-binding protein [Candidatus Heimdallarchaeota archaeon]